MADDHLIPNTTQVPNAIMDLLMPFLNDGESRVLLYLCRRTYGFQRETDSVSRDQFVNGIQSGGRQLDFGAGVSRQGAMNALAVLTGLGIVEQLSGGRGRGNVPVFKINLKCEIVQWLDIIRQHPETARELIVQRLDLIRQKSLPYGPFHRKPKKDTIPEENVKTLDILEKVETDREKGLTVRPTKPSSTKPRKEKTNPPEKANAFSVPQGADERDGSPEWMRTWKPAKRFPVDFPMTPPDWFLTWAHEKVPHVDVDHEWPHMRDYTYKANRTQFFMCAQKWMENEEVKLQGNGARASPTRPHRSEPTAAEEAWLNRREAMKRQEGRA